MERFNDFKVTDLTNIERSKYNSFMHAFEKYGLSPSKSFEENEYRLFLNSKSSTGYFDSILCDKLFQYLNFNEKTIISIPEFILGFIHFEEDIQRKAESSRIKFTKEQTIYNKILKQCIIHKKEKLNSEGFCENAKIIGEISDIDIKQKLKGIKEIKIIVIFNEEKKEIHFNIGGEATYDKKTFEFRPSSRKDTFKFIMRGINDSGKEFNIGSKIFPLDDIESREKYLVQITVPDLDNPKKIAAFININIIMYMNYYNYYENLRIKQEKKIKKSKLEANLLFEDLQNIGDIYDGIMGNNIENNEIYITERAMYRKRISLHGKMFTHSKRASSPKFESGFIQHSYRNNYNSPIQIHNINNNIVKQNKQLVHKREFTNNISHINYINNINENNQSVQGNTIQNKEKNLNKETNQSKINNQNQQIYANTINKIIINKSQYPLQHQLESQISKNIQQSNKKIIKNTSNIQSSSYIQLNQHNSKLNTQNKNIQLQQDYNLANSTNSATTTKKIISTKIEQNQNQTQSKINQNVNTDIKINEQLKEKNNKVTEIARASVHQIIGEIAKKKTIMTNTQYLSPVRKKTINVKNSTVSNAIITHKINKEIVEENTLPVSYLPEKVNEIIYQSQIIYLPLINMENKDNYKIIQPTINEFKVYVNEGNKNIINNNINLYNQNGNNNSKVFDKNNKTNVIQIPNKFIKNELNNSAINSNFEDLLKNNLGKITQINKDINVEFSNSNKEYNN